MLARKAIGSRIRRLNVVTRECPTGLGDNGTSIVIKLSGCTKSPIDQLSDTFAVLHHQCSCECKFHKHRSAPYVPGPSATEIKSNSTFGKDINSTASAAAHLLP